MPWPKQRGGRWLLQAAAGLMMSVAALTALTGGAAAEEPAPLRLCADPDDLPFSSSNAATPGFYIEVGGALARALGRPFEPVWVPTYYTKRQIRQKLLTGQCDGFVGVPDEADFMGPRLVFSKPVVKLGYALVAPDSLAVNAPKDLHGRHVAVQFASPPQDLLAKDDSVQMVTALSALEAMRDLADDKADAAFIWGPSAGWINATVMRGAFKVVPVEGPHMQWEAGIAFPRDHADLRDQVDHALEGLEPVIQALAVKYDFPLAKQEAQAAAGKPAAAVAGGAAGAASGGASPAAASTGVTAADAADVAAGHTLFNANCSHCHGPDAVQGEQRRNLRLLHQRYGDEMPQMFMTTVTHGRLSKGMPNWSGIISPDEFHKILAFLSSVQEPGS